MSSAPAGTNTAGKSLAARIHLWIRAHRRQSFLLAALCWGAMALAATGMRTDTGSRSFFPDGTPELRQLAEALDISPASRLLFVDISSTQPDRIYALAQTADAVVNALDPDLAERAGTFVMPEPERLLTLLPFLTDAAAVEFLLAATSDEQIDAAIRAARAGLGSMPGFAGLQWLRADPLAFRRIFLSRLPAPEADVLPDPLTGYPVSRDGKHLLLILRPKHSLHNVRAATRLTDALEEALREHRQPDMQSLTAGGHRHSAANTRAIEQDVANIAFFSAAGLILVYLLLVRSRGALWLLLVPLFSATVALGGMALLLPVLSGLALGFGASVLGLAEDYAVHMHFALRSGRDPVAVVDTMAAPLFQGWLINVAGFAVLLLSGIPAVRQLAGFALLMLSTGFALALTIVPVCPWFAEPVTRSSRRSTEIRRPVAGRVIACAAVLVILCCVFFAGLRIDVSPRALGADVAQLQEDAARVRSVWGLQDREILVTRARDRETALDLARAVAAELRRQEPENEISALTDLWPASEQSRENRARWNAFVREHGETVKPRIREAARKYGFTEDAFAPFEQLLSFQTAELTPELFRAAGLGEMLDTFVHEAEPGDGQSKVLLFARKKPDLSALPQELRPLALSPGLLETALLKQLEHEKRLVPLAQLACVALLCLYFRDIRRTLLASLPPLCSITAILAWMTFTDTPLTPAGMAALPLVLGLAADHGIMVSHDLAHGIETGVERAVLVASLTALAGMGLLALARHPALNAMGTVIFLGLLVEVPAALWLLPRLCRPHTPPAGSAA